MVSQRDQLDEELAAPEDRTGLVGAADTQDDSGLAGTANMPDNTGLAGSSGAPVPRTDEAVAGDPAYGNDTGFTGNYGAGIGGPGMSGQTRTPDSELLDPGYNPKVDASDRLDDLNRVGQPGTPGYEPDYRSAPGQPAPSPYSGSPSSPGIPDQAGTQDQTTYTSRSGSVPLQGDGSSATPDQSGS